MPRDFEVPCNQRIMWLYGWEPLIVSHSPAKFGGHGHCGSGDLFLVVEEEDSRCSGFNSPLLSVMYPNFFLSRRVWHKVPRYKHEVSPQTAGILGRCYMSPQWGPCARPWKSMVFFLFYLFIYLFFICLFIYLFYLFILFICFRGRDLFCRSLSLKLLQT